MAAQRLAIDFDPLHRAIFDYELLDPRVEHQFDAEHRAAVFHGIGVDAAAVRRAMPARRPFDARRIEPAAFDRARKHRLRGLVGDAFGIGDAERQQPFERRRRFVAEPADQRGGLPPGVERHVVIVIVVDRVGQAELLLQAGVGRVEHPVRQCGRAADVVLALEDDDLAPGFRRPDRPGQAGASGPDHDQVIIDVLSHFFHSPKSRLSQKLSGGRAQIGSPDSAMDSRGGIRGEEGSHRPPFATLPFRPTYQPAGVLPVSFYAVS